MIMVVGIIRGHRALPNGSSLSDRSICDGFPPAIADKNPPRAPREIWLDLDATDDPLHGHQEGRFFRGYYRCYCYLPLYIFCGAHPLCE